MKRIVINACGLKSKGGITVFKKLIKNNTDVKFYIVYDNFELKQLVGNNESIFIKTPRYLQPFLNSYQIDLPVGELLKQKILSQY